MTDKTFNKYCLVIDEWFVNGRNGTKAYQKFYPSSNNNAADVGFREIYGNLRIKKYVESKEKETSLKLQITLESQLIELNKLLKLCKGEKKYSDAINALKEQNKLLGLYEEHNKQKNQNKEPDLSNLTDKEIITLSQLKAKINA